jgi:outer membrane protein, multidrug efflux system
MPLFLPGPRLLRRSSPPVPLGPCLALALLITSPPMAAQAPAADWRQANQDVGQFERGHIDLLRWESTHLPPDAAAEPPPAAASWQLADAIVAAQRTRPDLMARPGLNSREQALLQLQQRELALQVERAWWQALAARQHRRTQLQVLQAAEAGHALAQRMAQVGNWPAARQQRETLGWVEARAQLQLAEHGERTALLGLWRLVGTDLGPEALAERLPQRWTPPAAEQLPDEPSALEQQALQRHPHWPLLQLQAQRARQGVASLQALQEALFTATAPHRDTGAPQALPGLANPPRWPHAWEQALQAQATAAALERRIRADVRVAHSAWRTARHLAQDTATEAQRLHTALEEDMLQRYNGMFNSTWDLLGASRARLQAANATQQAQLNAALALADLRAVLDGLPYSGSGPSASPITPNATPGH